MIPHPSPLSGASYSAAELGTDDAHVLVLDQRLLPLEEKYLHLGQVEEVAEAIRTLTVRGAPAIGIAAAYAMVLASRSDGEFLRTMERAADLLKATRPTAVNLAHGVDALLAEAHEVRALPRTERIVRLAARARAYHRADVEACRTMGRLGQALLPEEGAVLTHCNAGALATGGYGSALGVIRAAREANKRITVIADETRPLLQGARLTAWELMRDSIPVTLITDSMAASLMAKGSIVAVVVGADRIARNGDVANKIGTYGVACLAHAHEIPFYVAAPWSTVDLACESGARIPIEARRADEVTNFGGRPTAPHGVAVENPSFDVTPARLVRAIMTERGVVAPADIATLASK